MKLPVPQEVLDSLTESSGKMEEFGAKLDRVIELLEDLVRWEYAKNGLVWKDDPRGEIED